MDFFRSEGIAKRQTLYGEGKLSEHGQNLQGCKKCNLRKAVGNLELPYGCEITVIVQEGLKTCILAQEGLFNSYIK